MHIPPPINGAAMVGEQIKNSKKINSVFETDYINLTTSFNLNKIGKGGVSKIFTAILIAKKVIQALRKKDYDLCYMTLTAKGFGFYKDFLIVLVLKLFGKEIVYHFHNKGVEQNSGNTLNRLLYTFTFKNTKSIQLSPLLYYDIKRYVLPKDVHFCANGIPDAFESKKEKENNLDSPCKFLFLSNMMEEKGVLILLEACGLLKKRALSFECHFIGAWSDISEEFFYEKIGQLDIADNVFAHGKQYGSDKVKFFSSADVFVFPTFYNNECFPLVLLEAMQYGLPVVSTREGGIADIVKENMTGFLVPRQDEKELASVLVDLIVDVPLREQMGEKGRERFEDLYTSEIFEANLLEILNDVIR